MTMQGSTRRRFGRALLAASGALGLARCSLLSGLEDLHKVECIDPCQDGALGDAADGEASAPTDGGADGLPADSPSGADDGSTAADAADEDASAASSDVSQDGPDAQSDAPPDGPTSPEAGPDTGGKCGNGQLAVPNGASASSTIPTPGTDDGPPAAVIDGNLNTRWESVFRVDPQWVDLDFRSPVFVRDVQILWEAACARDYTLQVSNDSSTWKTVGTITNNTVAANPLGVFTPPANWTKAVDSPNLDAVGRYLRVNATARCQANYGYSIWEMRVFGDSNAGCTP
jgi:hypothetical protein